MIAIAARLLLSRSHPRIPHTHPHTPISSPLSFPLFLVHHLPPPSPPLPNENEIAQAFQETASLYANSLNSAPGPTLLASGSRLPSPSASSSATPAVSVYRMRGHYLNVVVQGDSDDEDESEVAGEA